MAKSYFYADGQIVCQYKHMTGQPVQKSFNVHDRLGSVRMLVDTSGLSVAAYTYEPFGKLLESQTAVGVDNPFLFTGQYFDSEIDQYYLRARQYDPRMMRFTSRDPKQGIFEEPLLLHRYLYCYNNPTCFVDLNGEVPVFVIGAAIGGIAGAVGNAIGQGYEIWRNGAEWSWKGFLTDTLAGAFSGAILTAWPLSNTVAGMISYYGAPTAIGLAGVGTGIVYGIAKAGSSAPLLFH